MDSNYKVEAMFPTGDGFYYVFVSECDEPLSDSCYIVRTIRNEYIQCLLKEGEDSRECFRQMNSM